MVSGEIIMTFGYRIGVVLTSLVLITGLQAAAAPARKPPCPSPALYSAHALRRIRTLLQLQRLELRRERLQFAAAAIEHRISVDELLRETSQPAGVTKEMELKQLPCLHAITIR